MAKKQRICSGQSIVSSINGVGKNEEQYPKKKKKETRPISHHTEIK